MLNQNLNYIITIAEEQNLTRAAKRLFISQPTLTLFLNRLESELGVKLFDRSKTPVTLTKAGEFYIEEMKKLSASEQMLRNDIRFIANPTQTLIVGMGQVRGHHWLPMILPVFCSNHPDINIQLVQGTEQYMCEALHTHHMDVAFGVLPSSISDLETVELMYEKLFLAAHRKFGLIPTALRKEHSAENPYIILPENLDGLPFITPQITNGLYNSYEKIILNKQIQPSRIISVNNQSTGLMLTINGLGVQLIPGSILSFNQNKCPGLEQLDFCTLEDMPQTRKCVAAFNSSNIKRNLIMDFIRIVQNDLLPICHYITILE